jgi:hypothetical protein
MTGFRKISVTNDHGYVLFYVKTTQSYAHSCFIAVFVTRAGATSEAGTAYPSRAHKLTPVSSGIRITQSAVYVVVFCRQLCVLFLLIISLSVFLRIAALSPFVYLNFSYILDQVGYKCRLA